MARLERYNYGCSHRDVRKKICAVDGSHRHAHGENKQHQHHMMEVEAMIFLMLFFLSSSLQYLYKVLVCPSK